MYIETDHFNRLYRKCVMLSRMLESLGTQQTHTDDDASVIRIYQSSRARRKKLCNGHQVRKISEHTAIQYFYVQYDVLDCLIGYDWRLGVPGRHTMNSIIPLIGSNIKLVNETELFTLQIVLLFNFKFKY